LSEAGDDNAFIIAKALGHIAKMCGMTKLAKDTNISRGVLDNALSGEGNSEFRTISK
jgi:probable addiction module antidote protein